ncbi:hypothetical protein Psfp_01979 [Pelotomaculum sp. FP]|nr:hypothetical protein Psfp_01979 [Pelotomaculum sp. FP]
MKITKPNPTRQSPCQAGAGQTIQRTCMTNTVFSVPGICSQLEAEQSAVQHEEGDYGPISRVSSPVYVKDSRCIARVQAM